MRALNNVASQDAYAAATTIEGVKHGRAVSLHVFNQAVVYQVGTGWPGIVWGDEVRLEPGFHELARRCSGVRFKSAVAGNPARVTALVRGSDDA